MGFNLRCPQCLLVSQSESAPTPCSRHGGKMRTIVTAARQGTPAAQEEVPPFHPTADNPFPFHLVEYARLLLLRSRVRDDRESPPPDEKP